MGNQNSSNVNATQNKSSGTKNSEHKNRKNSLNKNEKGTEAKKEYIISDASKEDSPKEISIGQKEEPKTETHIQEVQNEEKLLQESDLQDDPYSVRKQEFEDHNFPDKGTSAQKAVWAKQQFDQLQNAEKKYSSY